MSEKLSERLRFATGELTIAESRAAVATLESDLAEMTRQRDEALKEPTTDEMLAVLSSINKPEFIAAARIIAARRKRITGDGA